MFQIVFSKTILLSIFAKRENEIEKIKKEKAKSPLLDQVDSSLVLIKVNHGLTFHPALIQKVYKTSTYPFP